jgi:hypothetical protein
MRILSFLVGASIIFASCGNSGNGNQSFCDTTCKKDTIHFKANDQLNTMVSIGLKNCDADTISWSHDRMDFSRRMSMKDLAKQEVRINPAAMSCVFQDTARVWLSFNDCITGRGFLFKLPFGKGESISQITGAINSFDPKFSIEPDLRAYTDRGSIFVINIKTGEEAIMTFKEQYDIDFDKIHEIVDSVNITSKRIYVELLKNGQEVPLEKSIKL